MKTKFTFLRDTKLLVIFFLTFATTVFPQNIINTLGTGGVFVIKDLSNNYLTLSQSTGEVNILGSLRLENTTSSSLGILFKGTESFLHNYGINNTFLGINSGNLIMTGFANTAVGFNTLFSNTNGNYNTALGHSSLYSNTSGYDNTAVGVGCLTSNTIGNYNSALGHNSLRSNNSGYSNTAIGWSSLFTNTSGYENTAMGIQSLYSNTTGRENTAVGMASLYSNTTGIYNTAVGEESLILNSTGSYNTAVGSNSLYYNTASYNTAVGHNSLVRNTTGENNTGLGYQALLYNITGNGNTAVGYLSGVTITTGSNLTCIGQYAQPSSFSVNNQITLGNGEITSLRCNVTTITSLSDARDKKNINDLSLGLDFLMKVKPRLFNWDKREWYENNIADGSKVNEAPTAGFIAQELDEVQTNENAEWLNLVLKDNPEKLEATPGNLLPVMVKAIQELKAEIDLLKQNNEKLTSELEALITTKDQVLKRETKVP